MNINPITSKKGIYMKKALIYARQSSGNEDLSESVEAQIQNCLRLAEKEHFEVIGIFRDLNASGELYPEGSEEIARLDQAYQRWFREQSGKKKNRSGLGALLKKLPEADLLLVNEMTRLYRPVNDSFLENYIHHQLRSYKITIVQVQGGQIDLSRFDQHLVQALKNQILYEDLRKKRENSIIAYKNKRNSGKLCCGSRIFAVIYHGKDRISIDPAKGEIVKLIYRRILQGAPLNSIIRECNRLSGKLMMYPSLLYSIARQPLYCGYQYNTEGELIRNVQIPGQEIISYQDWLSVQEILQQNRVKKKAEKKHWLPLSGKLYCGVCGSKLVCRIDHEKVYYICSRQKFDPAHSKCSQSRIRFESGAYGEYALYDAVIPILLVGFLNDCYLNMARENFTHNPELIPEDSSGKWKEMVLELFLDGYLTKAEMKQMLVKPETSSGNPEPGSLCPAGEQESIELCKRQIKRLSRRKISHAQFEDLAVKTDLSAVIYRDEVLFCTLWGEIRVPRLRKGIRSWMPKWSIRICKTCFSEDNIKLPNVKISYQTGRNNVLAVLKSIKFLGKSL